MDKELKSLCFIVLSLNDLSETARTELRKAIAELKELNSWRIEKVTIIEDQRKIKQLA